EADVRAACDLDEVDVGDFVPGVQRRQCERLLLGIQVAEIVSNGVGSPTMRKGALTLPEAVDQPVGERWDRSDGAIAAGVGLPASSGGKWKYVAPIEILGCFWRTRQSGRLAHVSRSVELTGNRFLHGQ